MPDLKTWISEQRSAREPSVSQGKLADEINALDPGAKASQSRVSEWERGDGRPTLRQFMALCSVLKLSPADVRVGRALWDAAQLEGAPFYDDLVLTEPL